MHDASKCTAVLKVRLEVSKSYNLNTLNFQIHTFPVFHFYSWTLVTCIRSSECNHNIYCRGGSTMTWSSVLKRCKASNTFVVYNNTIYLYTITPQPLMIRYPEYIFTAVKIDNSGQGCAPQQFFWPRPPTIITSVVIYNMCVSVPTVGQIYNYKKGSFHCTVSL